MNTDERRLKTIALSAFISVDRRLNLPFPDFFSSLFLAGALRVVGRRRAEARRQAESLTPHRHASDSTFMPRHPQLHNSRLSVII
jgi:hypothetical protein